MVFGPPSGIAVKIGLTPLGRQSASMASAMP
jgi:hypothetical protein